MTRLDRRLSNCSLACLAMICCVAMARPAVAVSCIEAAGRASAWHYSEQCRIVSPTGAWACSPRRSCTLIRDETRRGCAILGKAAPPFCKIQS